MKKESKLKEALKKLNKEERKKLNEILKEADPKTGLSRGGLGSYDLTRGEKPPVHPDTLNKMKSTPNKWFRVGEYQYAKFFNSGGSDRITIRQSVGEPGAFNEDIIKEEFTVGQQVSDKLVYLKLQGINTDFLHELTKLADDEPQITVWKNMFGQGFKTIPDLIKAIRQDKKIFSNKPLKTKLNKQIEKYYKELDKLNENKIKVNHLHVISENKNLIFEQMYNTIQDRGVIYGKYDGRRVIGIHNKLGDKSLFELFDIDSSRIDNRNKDFVLFDPIGPTYKFKYDLSLGEDIVRGSNFVIYPTKYLKEGDDGSVVIRNIADVKNNQFTISRDKYDTIKKSFDLMREMKVIRELDEPPMIVPNEGPEGMRKKGPKGLNLKWKDKDVPPEYKIKDEPPTKTEPKADEKVDAKMGALLQSAGINPEILTTKDSGVLINDMSVQDAVSVLKKYKGTTADKAKEMIAKKESSPALEELLKAKAVIDQICKMQTDIWKQIDEPFKEAIRSKAEELKTEIHELDFQFGKAILYLTKETNTTNPDYQKSFEIHRKESSNELRKILDKLLEQNRIPYKVAAKFNKALSGEDEVRNVAQSGKRKRVKMEQNINEDATGVLTNNTWDMIGRETKEKLQSIYIKSIDKIISDIKEISGVYKDIRGNMKYAKTGVREMLVKEAENVKNKNFEDEEEARKEQEAEKNDQEASEVKLGDTPNKEETQDAAAQKVDPVPADKSEMPKADDGPKKSPEEDTGEDMEKMGKKADEKNIKKTRFVLVQLDNTGRFQGIASVQDSLPDMMNKKDELEKSGAFVKPYTVTESKLRKLRNMINESLGNLEHIKTLGE